MLEWIIKRGGSTTARLTASRLLEEFGSLGAVLAAEPARLRRAVAGDDEAAREIAAFRKVMRHALREDVATRPVLGNWHALLDYLRSEMAFATVEQFRVLHLDVRNGLIVDDIVGIGTIDTAPVYVREIIRRALDVGTASLILAHNHPSGNPTASEADIMLTRHLISAARLFEISIHDHIIVSANSHISMRSGGIIQ